MKQLFSLLLILAFLAVLQATTGCANIIPPQGGPRDSLPPVLLNAAPADSTVNFRGNRIVLNFDEFVDLQEVQGNLLFTPLFENVPVVEARLRTVTIRLKDSLEANTTYTFDFGNALRDINEGNVYRNFAYRFSTGPYLDSMELSGRVVDAETGKTDTTMIVVLHRSFDDSAVYKTRPRYVSRVDRDGGFRFRSLPRDSFAIYAIGDAGIMRRYTSPAQAFGFANSAVVSGQDSVQLYAYKETAENTTQQRSTSTTGGNTAADRRLRFTSSGSQQDLLQDFTLTFERPLRQFDSTRVSLAADSTFTPVSGYRWLQDSTRRELSLRTQWQPDKQYHLILQQNFATDTLGRQLLKADTVSFSTRRLAEYGAINLEVSGIDTTQNPVLQFVQSDKVVYSVPIRNGRFTQQLFLPGDYDLRLLNDRNGNGRWDAGQFFGQRRLPEIARPFTQKITIRADRENDLSLPAPR
ncbi:Ig-like domain-containing protein [Cnuella takakiae]|uniref:Ig-like domain-containing protein n=1 Tax=Cnuella takakiae TaxID=1302690 RepID=A0A1M5H5G2_9BACT|nr:Ig-like domain-containing protein [Cnuella takakiae]OLY91108.1 hypothetical protein BUE76_03715 [Cnuella takakiae]SHG11123.1 Ig-like domain-containing protein [Cnuella takakiae]